MGILSYVASPLWMALLVLSTVEAVRWHFAPHDYFAGEGSLFPIWEVSVRAQATALFSIVMGLLFLPRILALVSRLLDADVRKSFGGGWRLMVSGVMETVFSTLVAPLLAVWQTQAVVSILVGRNAGWKTQSRGDEGTSVREAVRRHGAVVVLGVMWGCVLFVFANELFAWMVPVLLGLVLAVPVSVLSSKAVVGRWARRNGLFLTPEEVVKEPVLEVLREEWDELEREKECVEPHTALKKVLEDPHVRAVHLELVRGMGVRDPIEEHAVQGLVLKRRLEGDEALTDADQRRLLLSVNAVEGLVEGAG
jgi:membrane glycosyltransferase